MLLSWFIGVPQNGNILGTTVNFTDFGQPTDGTGTSGMGATMVGVGSLTGTMNTPGMAAAMAAVGNITASMNSSMVAIMSGFGNLTGTLSGGKNAASSYQYYARRRNFR